MMKAKPEMKLAWHNLMQEGKTPEQIAFQYGEHEVVVVKTLRHGTPKIKGASYQHLSLPIPINEIGEANANGTLEDLAKKYGVTGQTLKLRLAKHERGQHLTDPTPRKTHTRKIDKISDVDKTKAINDYYQSGRKLNCTEYTPNILRQILDEQNIKIKSTPVNSKYVVRLMDALLSTSQPLDTQKALRQIVSFTSDVPLAWKGQVLDLLLNGELTETQARCFNEAIDQVARLMGEDE